MCALRANVWASPTPIARSAHIPRSGTFCKAAHCDRREHTLTNEVSIIFIIALTFCVCVASTAFNLEEKRREILRLWWRNALFVCALAAGQGLMYWLGSLLGSTFMHMFEGYAKIIVLIICFMIAFRMMMDTLKIKSGKNLFLIDKPKQLIILSIALGINALIAGLMANDAFLPLFGKTTPLYIIGISLIWGFIGIGTKFSQTKLLINSLLNVLAALAVLATGFVAIV